MCNVDASRPCRQASKQRLNAFKKRVRQQHLAHGWLALSDSWRRPPSPSSGIVPSPMLPVKADADCPQISGFTLEIDFICKF
jgi:hypothetical protein